MITQQLRQQIMALYERVGRYIDMVGVVSRSDERYRPQYDRFADWFRRELGPWYGFVLTSEDPDVSDVGIVEALGNIIVPRAVAIGMPIKLFVLPRPVAVGQMFEPIEVGQMFEPIEAEVAGAFEERSAARRRAVKAVFDAHDRAHAPFYVYVEASDGRHVYPEVSRDAATARYAVSHFAGDLAAAVYLALFETADEAWPDPANEEYIPAKGDPSVAVAGYDTGMAPAFEYDPLTQSTPTPLVGRRLSPDERVIYDQVDLRFWGETGYKPGQRLNPRDPSDAAYVSIWRRNYHEVMAEVYAGLMTGVNPDWFVEGLAKLGVKPAPAPVPITPPSLGPVTSPSQISGVVGMNSNDPWRPILRNAPLAVQSAGNSPADRALARSALVGALAPALAPGTGPITARITVDGQQMLHAQICIDGKCYSGSVDLSGPVDAVLAKLKAWHDAQHANDAAPAQVGRGGWGGGGRWHGGGGFRRGGHYPGSWRRYGGGYSNYYGPDWYTPEQVVVEEVVYAPPDAGAPYPYPEVPYSDDPNQQQAAAQVQGIVQLAGDALVRELANQHVSIACAGWFDDLTHAVSSAANSVAHAVGPILKQFKGPLSQAAASAAMNIPAVGPVAGPAAGMLTGALIDAAPGGSTPPAVQAQAQQVIAQAQQVAQTNPAIAKALTIAKTFVAKKAAAAHLTNVRAAAQQGNQAAVQQVQQVQQDAQQGDPAAQQALAIINDPNAELAVPDVDPSAGDAAVQGWTDYLPGAALVRAVEDFTGSGPRRHDPRHHHRHHHHHHARAEVQGYPPGFVTIIGAAVDQLRADAQQRVMFVRGQSNKNRTVWGYVRTSNAESVPAFDSSDEADDWFGKLDPNTFLYAAYFDASDPTWPNPLNEATGTVVRQGPAPTPIPRQGPATVGHWALPLAFGAAAGAGGMYGWQHRGDIRKWLTGAA